MKMEIQNNNTVSAPTLIKKDGLSKSDGSTYSEFNGEMKNVSYTTSDNSFMAFIKRLLQYFYSFINKTSNDTLINYSENKSVTLPLPISNDVAEELRNKSIKSDSPYYFGFIDPNVDTNDFSIKLISEDDYDIVANAVNEGIKLMRSFYEEHDRLSECLQGYVQRENGAFTLKNAPQKDVAYFQKLEMINGMFIDYIKCMRNIYNTKPYENIENVNFYDSLSSPEFAPKSISSHFEDDTITLPLFASKDLDNQVIVKNDFLETDVRLSFIDPKSKTIKSDMQLLSDRDFTLLSNTVDKGIDLLVKIGKEQIDLNTAIREHLSYKDEQYWLQSIPEKYVSHLAKLEMINKTFIDFTQTIKTFYNPEMLAP